MSKVSIFNKIIQLVNFDISFFKKEIHSVVFIFIALTMGFLFMKNIGTLAGPDMFSAHYKATLATATGQSFSEPVEIDYGSRHLIHGEEKYFASGSADCIGGAYVSNMIRNPLQSDNRNACVIKHDKSLADEKIATTDGILQYPFFSYLPQSAGMAIGMQLDLEPVYAQTLSRFLNLLAYIALIVISIRIIPRGKWLVVLLAALPPSLYLASSLSADSLNIAWSFLFVSYVTRLYFNNEKITTKQKVTLTFLGVALFLLKVAYAPLAFLILALSERIISSRSKWIVFITIATVGVLLYSVWSSNWGSLNATADTSQQLATIVDNVPKFVAAVLLNVLLTPMYIFKVDDVMYVAIALVVLLMLISAIGRVKHISVPGRFLDFMYVYRLQILAVFAAGLSLSMTYSALLLTWTSIPEYGWLNIQGFQGRYTLPILPLLLVFYYFPQRSQPAKMKRSR